MQPAINDNVMIIKPACKSLFDPLAIGAGLDVVVGTAVMIVAPVAGMLSEGADDGAGVDLIWVSVKGSNIDVSTVIGSTDKGFDIGIDSDIDDAPRAEGSDMDSPTDLGGSDKGVDRAIGSDIDDALRAELSARPKY